MFSDIFLFFKQIWEKRRLVMMMTRRELISQYVGSGLGPVWMVIHPIVMITVYWFVFSVGFKVRPTGNAPFVVWLTAGLAPWFLFSNIVSGSTPSIVDQAHLIKKTIFTPQVLPLIKTCSSMVNHIIFLLILLILILFQHMPILIWFIQLIYYLVCLIVLALGISWFTATLFVFIRDVNQIVSVVLQVGFWVTPIFWNLNEMMSRPHKKKIIVIILKLLKLNPVCYIVQGFRDSLIYGRPFWDHPVYTLYFWCFTIVVLGIGILVFVRLRPQFSDVL